MPEEIIRRKRRLSSFQIIILGFAGVILLGALLLMLPISTTGGNVTPFNETLFTATSAVCVKTAETIPLGIISFPNVVTKTIFISASPVPLSLLKTDFLYHLIA